MLWSMVAVWLMAHSILMAGPSQAAGRQATQVPSASDVRFMTVDPGHFHAALVQKEMYAGVSPRVFIYAPEGADLRGHLKRIEAFNARKENPTTWDVDIRTGPDFFERMLKERPGNVVVLSGRNGAKIDRIVQSVDAGFHVLADKPWVLQSSDLPKLERALAESDRRSVVAHDIMTERYEITTILQRELVNDRGVFGELIPGTPEAPGVYMESVHHLMKVVAGAPNIRPAWFFDTHEQGEGLTDIGTHLVDLVQWTAFPDQALDHRQDVKVLAAQRWPTTISEEQFRRVTGEAGFPAALSDGVKDGALEYYCNTLVSYALRGVHITLNVIWDWEAPEGGGDTHYAVYHGSRSRVEVRQSKRDNYRTELYVVPNRPEEKGAVFAATEKWLSVLQNRRKFPGVTVEDRGAEIRIAIPGQYRVGHEAHFGEVTRAFLSYVADRGRLPAWERPNMLAKYFVTTMGTELSRKGPARVAPRRAP
jgi:predicted dehydrogenase